MRLLVVSNYYPPRYVGGYELGCRDVVERLRQRGHEVVVLTSDYEAARAAGETGALRLLPLQTGHGGWRLFLRSVSSFMLTLRRTRPDIVYFWNQAGLSYWLAPLARRLGYKCAFFISDASFRAWRVGAFLRRWVENPENADSRLARTFLVQGQPIIKGSRVQFASAFLRKLAGGDAKGSPSCVIHWGIDTALFAPAEIERRPSSPMRLLFVGQIIPEKGVATLIEAVTQLIAETPGTVILTIVGGTSKPAYLEQLRKTVRATDLGGAIQFMGKKERHELVEFYHEHDVLVLPSIWDEPFAITPLEAMACGLAVVATTTGGSAETFRDGENSLTFPAGDARACAAAIVRLQHEPGLYERIQGQAMAEVATRFTLGRMIQEIECDLLTLEKS